MKVKINDEIDLIELFNNLWKYRMVISVIIFFSVMISYLLVQTNYHNNLQYNTIIKYEINLSPSDNITNCGFLINFEKKKLKEYDRCRQLFTNKILSKHLKKKIGIKLKFLSNNQIKVSTDTKLKFGDIFSKSNNEITNIILNMEKRKIYLLKEIYNEIGVELNKNQKYIDHYFFGKQNIININNGIKIYNFSHIKTEISKFPSFKVIKFSIILSLLFGTLFLLIKLIKKKVKQNFSKKKK